MSQVVWAFGRAIALGLARSGSRLALVTRSRDELDQAAGQVRELGGKALVIAADLGDLASSPRPSARPAANWAKWTC